MEGFGYRKLSQRVAFLVLIIIGAQRLGIPDEKLLLAEDSDDDEEYKTPQRELVDVGTIMKEAQAIVTQGEPVDSAVEDDDAGSNTPVVLDVTESQSTEIAATKVITSAAAPQLKGERDTVVDGGGHRHTILPHGGRLFKMGSGRRGSSNTLSQGGPFSVDNSSSSSNNGGTATADGEQLVDRTDSAGNDAAAGKALIQNHRFSNVDKEQADVKRLKSRSRSNSYAHSLEKSRQDVVGKKLQVGRSLSLDEGTKREFYNTKLKQDISGRMGASVTAASSDATSDTSDCVDNGGTLKPTFHRSDATEEKGGETISEERKLRVDASSTSFSNKGKAGTVVPPPPAADNDSAAVLVDGPKPKLFRQLTLLSDDDAAAAAEDEVALRQAVEGGNFEKALKNSIGQMEIQRLDRVLGLATTQQVPAIVKAVKGLLLAGVKVDETSMSRSGVKNNAILKLININDYYLKRSGERKEYLSCCCLGLFRGYSKTEKLGAAREAMDYVADGKGISEDSKKVMNQGRSKQEVYDYAFPPSPV